MNFCLCLCRGHPPPFLIRMSVVCEYPEGLHTFTNSDNREMELPVPIREVVQSLGLLDRHQLYGYLINLSQRTACILSLTSIICPVLITIISDAKTFVDVDRALIGLMCGMSSLGFYLVTLMNRRPILDVTLKLQSSVNERKAASTSGVNEEICIRFENMASRIHFAIFRVFVELVTIPTMLYSYVLYYTTGDPETSFRLALQMA